jgi:hypothetical protein
VVTPPLVRPFVVDAMTVLLWPGMKPHTPDPGTGVSIVILEPPATEVSRYFMRLDQATPVIRHSMAS